MQKHFLTLLQEVKERGGGVLLSSHVLTEVESICDSIVMIKQGRILHRVKTQELLESLPRIFRFPLNNDILAAVRSAGVIDKELNSESEARIYTREYSTILKLFHQLGWTDFYIERPSLEELFMHYYE
jgi:ABC-2 type transport system ATP-binding protein